LEFCLSELMDFTKLSTLPLTSVTFKYHDALSRDAILPPLLSLFLSPGHLQRLSTTSTEILPIISSLSFNQLFQLEVPVECLTSEVFGTALSHCPALEQITLQTDSEGHIPPHASVIPSIPRDALPNLKFYRGPRNFVVLFARRRRIQTIEISLPVKVHPLLLTLDQLQSPLDFLSFHIDGNIPKTLLEEVHNRLPTLHTLSINDPPVTTGGLQALLGETSPRLNTQVFCIRIEGRHRSNLWIPPVEEEADVVECFNEVGPEIERVYPNLSTLKLVYGVEDGSVVWRHNATSGHLVQTTMLQ
jgi:hypothetical protein